MKHPLYLALILLIGSPLSVFADDWPMWRKDAGRTATVSTSLPETLKIQWVRDLPPITPAYHNLRLQFDAGYEPIVAKDRLLVSSSLTDSVTSFDAETGQEIWSYTTNGPVRFAPAVWEDSVCFGSDDGCMYCVSLQSGELLWKLKAVPNDRRVLGNRRLISMWPVRGGPVIADGTVYFAAGVWPFEGVFVYAVDIKSGKVNWRNDRLGYRFGKQPHNTQAIGGLAPQGYLVVNGDELIVPCSTAYPATLDRKTGELIEFELPTPGRFPGGWFAAITPAQAKAVRRGQLTFDDLINRQQHEDKLHKGEGTTGVSRTITAADQTLSFDDSQEGVEGSIHSMVIANRRLYVSTLQGKIYCLSAAPSAPTAAKHWPTSHDALSVSEKAKVHARSLVSNLASDHGIAFVVGLQDGSMVKSLLIESDLHVIAIDDQAERVDQLRSQLVRTGQYGSRAAVVHCNDIQSLQLPPYITTLLTTERQETAFETWRPLLQSLRPFGGTAALAIDAIDEEKIQDLSSGEFATSSTDAGLLVKRIGQLPGSTTYGGDWSASPDQLVRFPLGVLWFDDTLAHFKRSPQPRFVDGVMISQPKDWNVPLLDGDNTIDYPLLPHILSDIYTGRVLADSERLDLRESLETTDPSAREARQYRPPRQKNAWKPEQPIAGERTNPLTGETEVRAFPKTYGCDGGVDYGDLYTMRSGTPAFYDKKLESGTVFLSGPRSGCTNSIIPAGGLLNVPYFYEGCTCSYPLPSALALIAMPESHEQWSSWGASDLPPNSIRRIGINFGAPGDRMARNGTLWLDYPSVGGPSPAITTTQSPKSPSFHYQHSLWTKDGDGHGWIVASRVEGLGQLTLDDLKPGTYDVRLYFAEPKERGVGRRVQQVSLQDRVVLPNFDILAAAGERMKGVVREFKGIEVDGRLKLSLSAVKNKTLISGMEAIRRQ